MKESMNWTVGLRVLQTPCSCRLSEPRRWQRRTPAAKIFLLVAWIALTLNAGYCANQPPTISAIPNQVVLEDQPTDAIQLGLSDAETSVLALQLSGISSNPTLVPNENI